MSVSGRARHGFDARTSSRVAAKSGALFDYFQNADGSFTRKVSQTPINYRDASGDWQPIDTSLVMGVDGRWREKANTIGVSFSGTATGASASASGASLPWRLMGAGSAGTSVAAASSTGELATVSVSSSESVSWSLQGANDVPGVVSGSTAEYDGILPGTNMVVEPTGSGVKESLVLTSASAPTSWVFPLSLTGLSAVTGSGGEIELVDSAGAVQATLPQAYAYDAYVDPVSGERHENWAMTYTLTTVNGGPAIVMALDSSWLSGSSIQFPVTVDPTLTVSIAGQTETTYVMYPYTNDYSSSTVLKVGTPDGGSQIAQAYLKFPTLPADGSQITSAQLGIFDMWAYTCSSSTSYAVYPVTSSWSVTGSKSWPGPGTAASIGTWSGTVSSTVCGNTGGSSTVGQWQYTTLSTSYFQNIALGKTPNNGISVFSSGTDSNQWKQFDSSQISSHSPYLYLTYTPNQVPDIEHTFPPAGYASPTLTPQLQVQAVDPDTWPNSSMTYDFAVYNSAGTKIVQSGNQSSTNWVVPASANLGWSTAYYWTVSAFDGFATTTSPANALTPTVPQPLVTSRLAQNSGHGFDPEAGNYTTSATDANVATVGPVLSVTRSYNSLDARVSSAFGAGWSSIADVKAVMDADGSKNVVLTDVGGKQSRYGYTASGYVPPMGTFSTLTAPSSGGYSLLDKSGTTYAFAAADGANTYLLSSITTHAGLVETFTYNASYQLTRIENTVSSRSLFFVWAKPVSASFWHVATVTTDDATANDDSTAILWTYNYVGDQLRSVCPPSEKASASDTASTSCTAYAYTSGSNYPAATLDANPYSYWRLDEASGTTAAASSVLSNEQTDVGAYTSVALGSTPGRLRAVRRRRPFSTGPGRQ